MGWAKCENLCDPVWWETANVADVKAEVDAGADVLARDLNGATPLHYASSANKISNAKTFLAELQVSDVHSARIWEMWPKVRNALSVERAVIGTIRLQPSTPDKLLLKISKPERIEHALATVEGLAFPVLSVNNLGAKDIVVTADGGFLQVKLSETEKQATNERTVKQALEIIRRRVREAGIQNPIIQREGNTRILIQVPGIGLGSELKAIIGTTAQLTFKPVVARASSANAPAGSGNEILPSLDEEGVFFKLEKAPVVTGEELVDAQPSFDQNGHPAVKFRFNTSGARKFGNYTAENIGSPFAIVLDDEVISAPVIAAHISNGSGILTGGFTVEETTKLAVLLRAGALPAKLNFMAIDSITPDLLADRARTLLDAGANLMAQTNLGLTALHWAAAYGSPSHIQILLTANADAGKKDNAGKKPWDYAQKNKKIIGSNAYWALNNAEKN